MVHQLSPDPDITFVNEKFNEVIKEIKMKNLLFLNIFKIISNDRKGFLDAVYEGLDKDKRSGQYKTLSHYEILYNDLVKFSEKTRKTYHFRDINKKFKDDLIKFYLDKGSKKKKKRGSFKWHFEERSSRNLNVSLTSMTEDGVNKLLEYKAFSLKGFKVGECDDNIYALTVKEFEKFKNFL